MRRTNKICCLFIAAAISMTAGVAAAQAPSPPAQTDILAEKQSHMATVKKVDTANRRLLLKDDQGKQFSIRVPEEMERFNAIKKGDRIKVDYYESIAL